MIAKVSYVRRDDQQYGETIFIDAVNHFFSSSEPEYRYSSV